MIKADICIIGGGAGGLSVAAGARAFGASVVLIEQDKMGGDCLNSGCVPSKALIEAAKKAHAVFGTQDFGISFEQAKINYPKVQAHIKEIIAQIAPHDSVERFEGLGVKILKDTAQFIDRTTVKAGDNLVKARRFIIATGSRPLIPAIEGLENITYLTNENIFELKLLPKHLIIIGGGAIGMEMAQAYSRLGAKVTIIEKYNALNQYDKELGVIAINRLRNEGVCFYENTNIKNITKENQQIHVSINQSGKINIIKGTHLLIAAGRKPNIEALTLEKANVEFSKNGIKTDSSLRTTNRKIYAIGDVTGKFLFTHSASYQASLVVRNALFALPIKMNKNIIPHVSYLDPEVAHVGLSEKQAKELYGKKIKIIRSYFSQNDRAVTMRKPQGLLKLIIKNNGQIIGCSIVGENAAELICLFSLAIANRLKTINLASFIAPYPSLSEIAKRAGVESFREKLSNIWIKGWIGLIKKLP